MGEFYREAKIAVASLLTVGSLNGCNFLDRQNTVEPSPNPTPVPIAESLPDDPSSWSFSQPLNVRQVEGNGYTINILPGSTSIRVDSNINQNPWQNDPGLNNGIKRIELSCATKFVEGIALGAGSVNSADVTIYRPECTDQIK